MENGLSEGMRDDTINISVTPYWVKQDLGDNRYLVAELWFSPRKGDRIQPPPLEEPRSNRNI